MIIGITSFPCSGSGGSKREAKIESGSQKKTTTSRRLANSSMWSELNVGKNVVETDKTCKHTATSMFHWSYSDFFILPSVSSSCLIVFYRCSNSVTIERDLPASFAELRIKWNACGIVKAHIIRFVDVFFRHCLAALTTQPLLYRKHLLLSSPPIVPLISLICKQNTATAKHEETRRKEVAHTKTKKI